jgi:hypothetical protein
MEVGTASIDGGRALSRAESATGNKRATFLAPTVEPMTRADHADGRRPPSPKAEHTVGRWPVRRSALARIAVGVALVVVALVLWMLILRLWADVAGRAVPPVSSALFATEQGPE